MKRIIFIIFFLSVFFISEVSAQNKFSFSLGGGYVTSALDKTKLPYWEDGYLINFSSDYKVTKEISIFLSSSFQQNYFNSKLVDIVVPAIAGYRYSISGEKSNIIELSVGSRLYISDTRVKPYLGIGTGLLIINQGKVEITNWMEGNPNRSTSLYSNSNKNYNVAQINIGLGFEVKIINNFNLVLDGKLISCFGGPTYFPLIASVKYDL